MLNKSLTLAFTIFCIFATLTSAFTIQVAHAYEETFTINEDGSITPETAPVQQIGDVYLLTENITTENPTTIIIRKSNIVFDGQGHTLTKCGIRTILVQNLTLTNFQFNESGISLSYESEHVIIHKNNFSKGGISLHYDFGGHEITQNTLGGIGSVMDCSVANNLIAKNNVTSIQFYYNSYNNTIIENNITGGAYGIYLGGGVQNYIANNNLVGHKIAIYMANFWMGSVGQYGTGFSQNNTIIKNHIASNTECGIVIINGTNTSYGIWGYSHIPNYIHHNIFENNTNHVSFQHTLVAYNYTDDSSYGVIVNSTNIMDDGYPSGGNYWDDYMGIDANMDGIGDTPYLIDDHNTDHYPLMKQSPNFVVPEIPLGPITSLLAMLSGILAFIFVKKKPNKQKNT